jgi:hypothetical protein
MSQYAWTVAVLTARRFDDLDDASEEHVLVARARWLRHRDGFLARWLLHHATRVAPTRAWCSSAAGRCSLMRW